MFTIIATVATGILLGYLFREKNILQNTEKTISWTIFTLLFIMGINIGSNEQIINNLGSFGWQAAVMAAAGTCGSVLAAWIVLRLFFRENSES